MRGLKLLAATAIVRLSLVAPLVGAWIETAHADHPLDHADVAPLVGAWIETTRLKYDHHLAASHLS